MGKFRDKNGDAGKAPKTERLLSLDALRGAVLLVLVSAGFGLKSMLPGERWEWLTSQWAHREWTGCTLWDLLEPALLFTAGVALAYSYANRQAAGQNWFRQFFHALLRAVVLFLLGCYLDSYRAYAEATGPRGDPRFLLDPRGELQQLALAYLLTFLVVPLGMPIQGITAAFLLIGHTAAYVIYASASGQALWSATHPHVGTAIDQWLNLGPHPEKLVAFNVVMSSALMLIGVLVAGLIRSGLTPGAKVAIMTAASFVGIALGWSVSGGGGFVEWNWFAIIPMIRPIMTWTFVFTAVGWVLLAFTYFYLPIDALSLRGWSIPISLVGHNALIVTVTYNLFHGWAEASAKMFVPRGSGPGEWHAVLVSVIVTLIFWLLCWFLYRRQIFVKV